MQRIESSVESYKLFKIMKNNSMNPIFSMMRDNVIDSLKENKHMNVLQSQITMWNEHQFLKDIIMDKIIKQFENIVTTVSKSKNISEVANLRFDNYGCDFNYIVNLINISQHINSFHVEIIKKLSEYETKFKQMKIKDYDAMIQNHMDYKKLISLEDKSETIELNANKFLPDNMDNFNSQINISEFDEMNLGNLMNSARILFPYFNEFIDKISKEIGNEQVYTVAPIKSQERCLVKMLDYKKNNVNKSCHLKDILRASIVVNTLTDLINVYNFFNEKMHDSNSQDKIIILQVKNGFNKTNDQNKYEQKDIKVILCFEKQGQSIKSEIQIILKEILEQKKFDHKLYEIIRSDGEQARNSKQFENIITNIPDERLNIKLDLFEIVDIYKKFGMEDKAGQINDISKSLSTLDEEFNKIQNEIKEQINTNFSSKFAGLLLKQHSIDSQIKMSLASILVINTTVDIKTRVKEDYVDWYIANAKKLFNKAQLIELFEIFQQRMQSDDRKNCLSDKNMAISRGLVEKIGNEDEINKKYGIDDMQNWCNQFQYIISFKLIKLHGIQTKIKRLKILKSEL